MGARLVAGFFDRWRCRPVDDDDDDDEDDDDDVDEELCRRRLR